MLLLHWGEDQGPHPVLWEERLWGCLVWPGQVAREGLLPLQLFWVTQDMSGLYVKDEDCEHPQGDLVQALFLRRLPQSKKADQLFQSHQSSSLNLLTSDPSTPVHALHPNLEPANTATHLHPNPPPQEHSSTPAASHCHQRSPSPVSSTCWFHRTHGEW